MSVAWRREMIFLHSRTRASSNSVNLGSGVIFGSLLALITASCAVAPSEPDDDAPSVAEAAGVAEEESENGTDTNAYTSEDELAFEDADDLDLDEHASLEGEDERFDPAEIDAVDVDSLAARTGHAPGWTRPLAGYRVTQEFKGASVHNGIDLAKAYGSIVYAAHAGKVTEIIRGVCRKGYKCKGTGKNWALDPKYFMSGDKVVVTHPNGTKAIYDHTGAAEFAYVGKTVRRDTPIGRINRTGNRTGPHLHFAIQVKGKMVNPRNYIRF